MIRIRSLTLILMVAALAAVVAFAAPDGHELRPAAAFDSIADPAERSAALFTEAGKVLTHPRCINCHPAGDRPLQGEDGGPHQPPVRRGAAAGKVLTQSPCSDCHSADDRTHGPPERRGAAGAGVVGMRCGTCHLDENFDPGRVPGAPHWLLAPRTMVWEGLTLGGICEQVKDPERNGGRTLDEIVEHMAKDALVGWAWAPGAGRERAPGTQQAFGELIEAWVATGANCPD